MKTLRFLVGILVVVAMAAAEDPFRWSGRIDAGKAIEIKGVNGEILASRSADAQVEVTAVKSGRRSDPSQVKIEVVPHADGVTICAVYPSPDSRPNECKPGSGGRMNTRDNDVRAHFTLKVPAGVRFVGRTVNGRIEATGLASDVGAHSVNGSLTIATSGHASGATVNGGVTASLEKSGLTRPVEFSTVNGAIKVDLPADANAAVEAGTVNGGITTDFPLTVQGKFGPKKISGSIGGGGPRLALNTVNGGITLRQVR